MNLYLCRANLRPSFDELTLNSSVIINKGNVNEATEIPYIRVNSRLFSF